MPEPRLEDIPAEELREKFLRALADLDNLRKRSAVQVQAAVQHERRAVLFAFLEVVDNLERAMSAHPGESHSEWTRGVQAVHLQMLNILQRFGVEPFESLNRPFDPLLHEAIAQTKLPGIEPNLVMDVLLKGYSQQGGPILRPAKVRVSAPSDPVPAIPPPDRQTGKGTPR